MHSMQGPERGTNGLIQTNEGYNEQQTSQFSLSVCRGQYSSSILPESTNGKMVEVEPGACQSGALDHLLGRSTQELWQPIGMGHVVAAQ